jgi:hypothetical protein
MGDKTIFGDYEISLEEGHKYIAKNLKTGIIITELESVTHFIQSLFPKFEPEIAIKKLRNRRKYGNMNNEQIIDFWRKNGEYAAHLGTMMHSVMEELMNLNTNNVTTNFPSIPLGSVPFPISSIPQEIVPCGVVVIQKHVEQFVQHLSENHLVPLMAEQRVFSPSVKIAGTYDVLLRHVVTGQIFLYDFKRRKSFEQENKWEHGLEGTPVYSMPHCHFTSALIQLNLYRRMLLEVGIKVDVMRILTIHPEFENISFNDIPIDDKLVNELFEYRKCTLKTTSTA